MFYFQDLSLNVHSCLDLFQHGHSSSFENHWWYQHAALPRAIGSKIYIFQLVYKACMNLNGREWLVEMDWKKEFLKRMEILLRLFLKYDRKNLWNSSILRNVASFFFQCKAHIFRRIKDMSLAISLLLQVISSYK